MFSFSVLLQSSITVFPFSCLGEKLQRLWWMLISWERAESLQEVHCAVVRMVSCGVGWIGPRVWDRFVIISLSKAILSRGAKRGVQSIVQSSMMQHILKKAPVKIKLIKHLSRFVVRLAETAFKFCWVHILQKIEKGQKRCGWEERGKKTDKRGRLEECSRALNDGVMWRTKQRRWNPLVTFNDVFSVEASLCLCSGT